ncbi:chymotrypsin inhibitor-like [Rana temporaria]|uniref:chymotrypsin inhibitor-like n=1 Tax=Rana temporaria TaxID=8407 RepID=UPI001AADADEE|nr:chymotrypsin inhibitor-like [Rana temporaria]
MKVGAILLLCGFVVCASFIGKASSFPYQQNGSCKENEVYASCASPCPVTCANRSNPPQICMAMCKIGCACEKGYMYNSANTCVRAEECD